MHPALTYSAIVLQEVYRKEALNSNVNSRKPHPLMLKDLESESDSCA